MAIKSVGPIKSTIETLVSVIKQGVSSKDWNPFLDSFQYLYRDSNYSEYYIVMKGPFPLLNRDVAICEVLQFMYEIQE